MGEMRFASVVDRLEVEESQVEHNDDANAEVEEPDETEVEELLIEEGGIAEGLFEGQGDDSPYADGDERM